jgi:hypothetical protein
MIPSHLIEIFLGTIGLFPFLNPKKKKRLMKRGSVVEQPTTCNKEIWRKKDGQLKIVSPGTQVPPLSPQVPSDRRKGDRRSRTFLGAKGKKA